jgi:hypothetical protein
MNLVPEIKFDDALRNAVSLPIDEDFVDSDFIVR